ncbi:MAG: DNA-directed RNA polymerase subunit alpha C-terminal domain-containing protein [Candidatus Cloacimonetes bacterium]|nr:DNA-directed RNA polymerase subunit alpha C-terminal domain-containing protein [Candidatus Cloacimonadota bacterium]
MLNMNNNLGRKATIKKTVKTDSDNVINKKSYKHIKVNKIGYSVGAVNILSDLGMNTLGEVLKLDILELAKWRNCGERLASEIYYKSTEYIDGIINDKVNKNAFTKDIVGFNQYFHNDPQEAIRKLILTVAVNRQMLDEFPVFNEYSFVPYDVELHSSYAGDTDTKKLKLTDKENGLLKDCGISNIKELLMAHSQEIAQTNNYGYALLSNILMKLSNYLLDRPKTKNLFDYIEQIPITHKNMQLFLEYLCSETGQYISFKEVGERHGVTKQWVHNITEKYCTYIKNRNMNDDTLDDVLTPVTEYLKKYKGAIRIQNFLEEQCKAYCLDDVSLRRYLRFSALVPKIVEINQEMDLFWERKIPCLNCRSFKDEFSTHGNKGNEALELIDKYCIYSNCRTRKERSFDLGQIIYYSPYLQARQAINMVSLPETKKDAQLDFSEFYKALNVNLGEKQRELLEYIWKNGCAINQTRLEAYCRIKKIDLNSVVIETNAAFFEKFGKELIQYNHSEENWEINDTFLSGIANETHDTEQSVKYKESVSLNNSVVPGTTNQSLGDYLLEMHKTMLRNTLSKANHSYKFYWAEALFYFIAQGKTVVSLREMAACMCAHAWDDVLVKKYSYNNDDCIRVIVKELYITLTISPIEKLNTIYTLMLKTISKNEENKLLKYVPTHFINSYKCNINNS